MTEQRGFEWSAEGESWTTVLGNQLCIMSNMRARIKQHILLKISNQQILSTTFWIFRNHTPEVVFVENENIAIGPTPYRVNAW